MENLSGLDEYLTNQLAGACSAATWQGNCGIDPKTPLSEPLQSLAAQIEADRQPFHRFDEALASRETRETGDDLLADKAGQASCRREALARGRLATGNDGYCQSCGSAHNRGICVANTERVVEFSVWAS